jgi:hypothetical protein
MSDVIGFLFLPGIIAALEKAAPKVALEISHLPPSETLDADCIDLAVSMGLQHGGAIKEFPILEDRMMCLVRDGHPLQSKNDLDAFLAHLHLRIAMSPTDSRFVDTILAALGDSRDVAVTIPHWLLAPTLVRVSNLVAVMPGRLAQSVMRETTGLAIVKLPFATESFDWTIYWHRRHDKRAAHTWFRDDCKTWSLRTVGSQKCSDRALRLRAQQPVSKSFEIGDDLSRFGSASRLASWAALCPGKRKTGKVRHGTPIVRYLLCEASNAARKTKTLFRAKYESLVIRRGYKKTIIAIAHKLIGTIYIVLQRRKPIGTRRSITKQQAPPRMPRAGARL